MESVNLQDIALSAHPTWEELRVEHLLYMSMIIETLREDRKHIQLPFGRRFVGSFLPSSVAHWFDEANRNTVRP